MVLCANQIWWTAEVEDVFVRISHGQMEAMKNVSLFFLSSHFFFLFLDPLIHDLGFLGSI